MVMAAAWFGAEIPEDLRGVSIPISLDYLAPARATALMGVGRVLRRGRSLVNCGSEILYPAGTLVAKAIATYKVGCHEVRAHPDIVYVKHLWSLPLVDEQRDAELPLFDRCQHDVMVSAIARYLGM